MIVFVVAAAVATVYLCAVPVRAAVDARLGRDTWARVGLGLFDRATIWTWTIAPKPPTRKKRRALPLRQLRGPLGRLYRHTTIDRLDAKIATGDACSTALAAGFAAALLTMLTRRARVRPVFEGEHMQLALSCIVTVRLGHIMLAALDVARITIVWRIKSWTNGRLKASWPPRWSQFATWWT